MRRIILFRDTGELGNRLVTYAYLLALAREEEATLINLCFWRYAIFLENPSPKTSEGACRLDRPWPSRVCGNAANFVLARTITLAEGVPFVVRRFHFDNAWIISWQSLMQRLGGLLLRAIVQRPLVANSLRSRLRHVSHECFGHKFEALVSPDIEGKVRISARLVVRHQESIRRRLLPSREHRNAAKALLSAHMTGVSKTIGVHIRRGDYGSYRDGRWLYDHELYFGVMKHLMWLFEPDKVGFVVASDEPVPEFFFSQLTIVRAPGNLWADICCLALCDLIVGPPSTFSGWASFMGNKPIYWLNSPDARPKLDDLGQVWTPRWY